MNIATCTVAAPSAVSLSICIAANADSETPRPYGAVGQSQWGYDMLSERMSRVHNFHNNFAYEGPYDRNRHWAEQYNGVRTPWPFAAESYHFKSARLQVETERAMARVWAAVEYDREAERFPGLRRLPSPVPALLKAWCEAQNALMDLSDACGRGSNGFLSEGDEIVALFERYKIEVPTRFVY